MARPSKKTPEEKMRVVLTVVRGEATAAEAGRKAGVSEQTVSNWKRAFLDSGRAGLETGRARRSSWERFGADHPLAEELGGEGLDGVAQLGAG